jgi:WD40 repeat protein
MPSATQSRVITTLDGGSPTHVVFRPDSKTLIVLDHQGERSLFDVSTGKRYKTAFPRVQRAAGGSGLALSPDGWTVALAAGEGLGSLRLGDLSTGQDRELDRGGTKINTLNAVIYTPDGKKLISYGDFGGENHLWDVAGARLQRLGIGHLSKATISPGGQMIAGEDHRSGTVSLYHLPTFLEGAGRDP